MVSTNTTPNLPIVFEDSQLLIINKPPGILSQKDHTGDPDVFYLCKEYLAQSSGKKKSPYLGLLHRLDRPVGGLMMLAKTPQAAKKISRQIRDRLIQKTYHVIVHGTTPVNGVLTHYLLKDKQTNIVSTVSSSHKKGKRAVLSFARIKKTGELALLSVHLQTGRPHQIRVQMAAEGYPIWGDYKYGKDQPESRTIGLLSKEIILNHPKTSKKMRFELPQPNREPWNRFNH